MASFPVSGCRPILNQIFVEIVKPDIMRAAFHLSQQFFFLRQCFIPFTIHIIYDSTYDINRKK